jgi:hypothetical protein
VIKLIKSQITLHNVLYKKFGYCDQTSDIVISLEKMRQKYTENLLIQWIKMTSKTTMFSKTLKRLPKLTKGATINHF